MQLNKEFGVGREARVEKKKFLQENGGFRGLRKTFFKKGVSGVNEKISSFKSKNPGRPGQNNHLIKDHKGAKPDKGTKPNSNKVPDAKNSDADKEWANKSSEKLDKLKKNPKFFKKYESKTREEGIKEVNDAFEKKDIAKLRGIVEEATSKENLSSQDKLAAFGLGKKEDLVLSGKADQKGIFSLYKAKDTKNAFAQVSIGEKGELSFKKITNSPKPENKDLKPPSEKKKPNPNGKSILQKPDPKVQSPPELKSVLEK